VVGNAVAHGIEAGLDLADMDLATLQGFSPAIDETVFEVLTLEGSIAARDHLGGTAPAQVAAAARRAGERLAARRTA
jgi:argininosuccinate lyase